ncbi:amino acid ABC transporter permease [Amycolatopsis pithecellobii]|uniref:amino acid ABC transporter permease n=1 Tax=Amycolatopsis pithecellobii TaxID=664692 RepID=UPI0012B9834E|nr:amino acid ABC transporter permease [Amycolatopsis pithecellobii]
MFSLWGQYAADFADGLKVTVELTGYGLVLAIALGVVLAAARLSRVRAIRAVATVYVETARATPALVVLFLVYYGLGELGVLWSAFWSAVAGLGCFYAALFCEIFRGGLEGVERGQHEAADALGLGRGQRLLRVILPQAFLPILLPATNTVADLIKDTSLVVVLGVAELTSHANNASSITYRPMDMFLLAGLMYFGVYLLISRTLTYWEAHVQRHRH